MRTAFIASLIGTGSFCSVARAEIYGIPLPVTGEYTLMQMRDFSIDLGFPLAEVHSVQFQGEGTIVAPLASTFVGGPFDIPLDGTFIAALFHDDMRTTANTPHAGRATYPEPESFSGVGSFTTQSWNFLLDGRADGDVHFAWRGLVRGQTSGGRGLLTSASLLIDATPVPEPALTPFLSLALYPLLKRPRRAAHEMERQGRGRFIASGIERNAPAAGER